MTDIDDTVTLPGPVTECLAHCSRFTTVGGNKLVTGFYGGPLLMKAISTETIKRRCLQHGVHLNPEQLHRCVTQLRGVREPKRVKNSVGFVQRWRQPRIGI